MAAFITVQEVRDFIGGNLPTAGTAKGDALDVQLKGLVDAACDALRLYLGRRFTSPRAETTRYAWVEGSRCVWMDECVSVGSVRLDGQPLTGWRLVPGPSEGDFAMWLDLGREVTGSVAVGGTFGWEAVPPSLRQAAKLTVAYWWKREMAVTLNPESVPDGAMEGDRALPRRVTGLAVLNRYARPIL